MAPDANRNQLAKDWSPAAPAAGDTELTVPIMNWALVPESRSRGFCLCLHPTMTLINFEGLTCNWCGQPVTGQAYEPESVIIRTNAIKARCPQFVKGDQP